MKTGDMPLSGHLRELRNRLLVCGLTLFAAALAGLHLAPEIVGELLEIGRRYGYRFVYIAPQELLMQYFGVALLFAVCAALPVLLWQAWAFASPGLRAHENGLFLAASGFGLACFCTGVFFAWRVMLPFMLGFLSTLSSGSGIEAAISVQNYISFLMTLFIIFGIVFELPVVSIVLTWLGLLRAEWMRKGRRVMVVLIFVVAALITPPDVVSQVMVAIPMLLLYELSVLLCSVCQRLRKNSLETA